MAPYVNYRYPATDRVLYGAGAVAGLRSECEEREARRVLLLSTPSLRGSQIERRVQEILGERLVATSHESAQHVPLEAVTRLIASTREVRPDLVVTLGGGSVIDAGKALCAALAQGYADAEALLEHRIVFEYPDRLSQRPLTCEVISHLTVPTTLSAAEFDGIFGMTYQGTKDLYNDSRLAPRVVVHDPEVTLATPPALWAGTGIRALDHAVEVYLSPLATPVTDAAALHAVGLLFGYLRRSHEHPQDLDARLRCLHASWLSMIGVENVTLGLSHGIGHQIGARCGVPHGETSCVMLPTVMARMVEVTPQRLADLARAMGADPSLDDDRLASEAPQCVRRLVASLGLPGTLAQVGVTERDFELIAQDAMRDFVVAFAPISVSEHDIIELLTRAA
jgi:alcohol dehydrogenase